MLIAKKSKNTIQSTKLIVMGELHSTIDFAAWKAKKAETVTQHESGLLIVKSDIGTVLEGVLGYPLPKGNPTTVFFTQLQTGFAQVESLSIPVHVSEEGHEVATYMDFTRHAARPDLAKKIPESHPLGGFLLLQYLDADSKRPMVQIIGVNSVQQLARGEKAVHALFSITLAATGYQKYELVKDPQNVFATDEITKQPIQEVLSQFLTEVVSPRLPFHHNDSRLWDRASQGLNFFAYQLNPETPRGNPNPPRIA